MKRALLVTALMSVFLVGCDDEPAEVADQTPVPPAQVQQAPIQQPIQPQQQPQVVVVQQPPQQVVQQPSHDGFFTGMLMGHMLSGGSSHHTTVVHRTYVTKSYRPSRSYYGSSRRSFSRRR